MPDQNIHSKSKAANHDICFVAIKLQRNRALVCASMLWAIGIESNKMFFTTQARPKIWSTHSSQSGYAGRACDLFRALAAASMRWTTGAADGGIRAAIVLIVF